MGELKSINEQKVKDLISNPDKLLVKKPFTRKIDLSYGQSNENIKLGENLIAKLPTLQYETVSQDQFLRELDPNGHDVLYDTNVPSIAVKLEDNAGYMEIVHKKMALPYQQNIKNKQTLHLCGNPMKFTLNSTNPTPTEQEYYSTILKYWKDRNMDGLRYKLVDSQMSTGDGGLLFYMDANDEIKARLLSYKDGYVLCPHNDQNGDRILESVYYANGDTEYIDSYDKEFFYRYTKKPTKEGAEKTGWVAETPIKHGFDEIPLVTKRGDVSWNNGQSIIETLEIIWNIFTVIMKRHGWGILYIKGDFSEKVKKLAGSVILNDKNGEGTGDAKYLAAPTPEGMENFIKQLKEQIQTSCSTTFLLPSDIHVSGDISGIAIKLMQSADLEIASQNVIDYQNVANKMKRLFIYGLAKELVNKGIKKQAITEFTKLDISAQFVVWMPQSETQTVAMLTQLSQIGGVSLETLVANSPFSSPDEVQKIKRDKKENAELEASKVTPQVTPQVEEQNTQTQQ